MKKTMKILATILVALTALTLTLTAKAATVATISVTANGSGLIGLDPDTSVADATKVFTEEGRTPRWSSVFTKGLVAEVASSNAATEAIKALEVIDIDDRQGCFGSLMTLAEKAAVISDRITRNWVVGREERTTTNVEELTKNHTLVTVITLVDGTKVNEYIRPDGQYTLCRVQQSKQASKPDAKPTQAPTAAPTAAPTQVPTQAPTAAPTQVPTQAPTVAPTATPTPNPQYRERETAQTATQQPAAEASPAPRYRERSTESVASQQSSQQPAPTAAPVVAPTAQPQTEGAPAPRYRDR